MVPTLLPFCRPQVKSPCEGGGDRKCSHGSLLSSRPEPCVVPEVSLCYLTGAITCPHSAGKEWRPRDFTGSQGHEPGYRESVLPCLIPEPHFRTPALIFLPSPESVVAICQLLSRV